MSKHLEDKNLIARWLNNDLTAEEKAVLEKSGELDDLQAVMTDIDSWTLPPLDVEGSLAKLSQKRNRGQAKSRVLNVYWRYAAVLIVLMGIAVVASIMLQTDQIILATKIGEQVEYELPDGSLVVMSPLSEITYQEDDWASTRSLSLSGQAYFEVKKGSTFQVNTTKGSITVLGTKFTVNTSDNGLKVECYEGKVKLITATNEDYILKAPSAVQVDANGANQYIPTGSEPSWLNGFSRYENVNLSIVADDIKKYYDVTLNLPTSYASFKFSGRVTHDDLELALQSIFVPLEISYTLGDQNNVVFE